MFSDLSADRATTVERASDAIRNAMFAGQLRPGAALREVELADEMGVSRGTIREALVRLTAEGLLARTSFRGVQVKKLTLDDIHDMFLTRRVIELSAVDAAGNASSIDLEALYKSVEVFASAIQQGRSSEQNEADLNVHRSIVRLLQSPRLTHVHSGLMAEMRVALAAEYRSEDAVPEEDLIDRHTEFAGMIRANDIGAARTQLEQRLILAEDRLVARVGTSI